MKDCSYQLLLLSFVLLVLACNTEAPTDEKQGTPPEKDTLTTPPKIAETPAPKALLPEWPLVPKQLKGHSYPFDEASLQPTFKAFRDRLFQAVLDRDHTHLLSIVDEEIKVSFGDSNGKANFAKLWQLDQQPEQSPLWEELEEVLKLGGGFYEFDQQMFAAPWLFIIDDIEDPYVDGVVIGENVRLRAEPNSQSEILRGLSYEKIQLQYGNKAPVLERIDGEEHPWMEVQTAGGQKGYVYGKYVRLPVDYRALFKEREGQWRLISFIAGD